MMELRSGRVLNGKNLSSDEIIQECKMFFKFLFYEFSENFAYKVRIEDTERILGKRPTVTELLQWEKNRAFWIGSFNRVLCYMRREVPFLALLSAFEYFMKYECNLYQKNCQGSKIKSIVKRYLYELYSNINCLQMIQVMPETELIKSHAFWLSEQKLYLRKLASLLVSFNVNPFYTNPPNYSISWEDGFNHAQSQCCFISVLEDGKTVIKLPTVECYFDMYTGEKTCIYHYKVLKTEETFTSPESDIRKAVLLHKRCCEQNSWF